MLKFMPEEPTGGGGFDNSDLKKLAESMNVAFGALGLAKTTFADGVLEVEIDGVTAQFGADGRLLGGSNQPSR